MNHNPHSEVKCCECEHPMPVTIDSKRVCDWCRLPISHHKESPVSQSTLKEALESVDKQVGGALRALGSQSVEVEVKLAEEGTPLAIFQKERTDAISEMFDGKYADGIYPTSKFFARLDNCVSSLLSTTLSTLVKEMEGLCGEDKIGDNGVPYRSVKSDEFCAGISAAVEVVKKTI